MIRAPKADLNGAMSTEPPGLGDAEAGDQPKLPVPKREIWVAALTAAVWILLAAGIAYIAPDWVSPAQRAQEAAEQAAQAEAEAARQRAQAQAREWRPLIFVQEDHVNLRDAPSLKSNVLRRLSRAQRVIQIANQEDWRLVALGNESATVGWVHNTLIGDENPVAPILLGERYIPERGFRSFYNEVDRLTKELDCPLPEVTLGAARSAPAFLCRLGQNGQGRVTIDGIAGSIVIRQLRFDWNNDPEAGGSDDQLQQARSLAERIVSFYAPDQAQELASSFALGGQDEVTAEGMVFALNSADDTAQSSRSLVISSDPNAE